MGYIWNLKIPSSRIVSVNICIYIYTNIPIILIESESSDVRQDPYRRRSEKTPSFSAPGVPMGFALDQLRSLTLKECSYSPCWCDGLLGMEDFQMGMGLVMTARYYMCHLNENIHRVFMGVFKMLGKLICFIHGAYEVGVGGSVSWRIFCWLVAKKEPWGHDE